ncbi:MAG: hypothetical protein ABIP97_05590 [Chthoniobacterales bacterium]
MKLRTVKSILLRYRAGSKKIAEERDMERALIIAHSHPELEQIVSNQGPFDGLFHSAIAGIEVSDTTRQKFEEVSQVLNSKQHTQQFSFRNPALLSVLVSLLVLAFIGTWLYLSRSQTFPGAEEVEAILKMEKNSNIEQFDPVVTDAASLGDWFTMKGFDGYFVPPGLGPMQTAGAKIFRYEGQQVATVAIPEGKYFFIVFPATPLGVEIDPAGTWKIHDTEEGKLAVQVVNGMCFMVFSMDEKNDIVSLIRNLPHLPK